MLFQETRRERVAPERECFFNAGRNNRISRITSFLECGA